MTDMRTSVFQVLKFLQNSRYQVGFVASVVLAFRRLVAIATHVMPLLMR